MWGPGKNMAAIPTTMAEPRSCRSRGALASTQRKVPGIDSRSFVPTVQWVPLGSLVPLNVLHGRQHSTWPCTGTALATKKPKWVLLNCLCKYMQTLKVLGTECVGACRGSLPAGGACRDYSEASQRASCSPVFAAAPRTTTEPASLHWSCWLET